MKLTTDQCFKNIKMCMSDNAQMRLMTILSMLGLVLSLSLFFTLGFLGKQGPVGSFGFTTTEARQEGNMAKVEILVLGQELGAKG